MFPPYVNTDTTTTSFLRHIQEDRSLNIHRRENLKFYTFFNKILSKRSWHYSFYQLYHSPMRKIFSPEANVTSPGCVFVGQGKKTAHKCCNKR
jgi:hypothetical protein